MKQYLSFAVGVLAIGVTGASGHCPYEFNPAPVIVNGNFEAPNDAAPWCFRDCVNVENPKVVLDGTNSYLWLLSGDDLAYNIPVVSYFPQILATDPGKWATIQFDARCFGCDDTAGDAPAMVVFGRQWQIPPTATWTTYYVSAACISMPDSNIGSVAFGVFGHGPGIGVPGGEPEPGSGESELHIDNVCFYQTCDDVTNLSPAPSTPGNCQTGVHGALTREGVGSGAAPVCPATACCACADINDDGLVNVLDLIDLLLCYGLPAYPNCLAEDLNCDGTVNVLDQIILLLLYGQPAPSNCPHPCT